MDDKGFIFVVVIGTAFVLGLIGIVGLLMVANSSRRQRHRAELAELGLRHAREVRSAEREAVRQTLQEVGAELHDNVSQLLMVIHMGLNWLPDGETPLPRLDASREALAECIREVRRLGHTLDTDLWEHRSLEEALVDLADRLKRTGKLDVQVTSEGLSPDLPNDVNTILFRVCQEVVSNAVKHSGAKELLITLHNDPVGITLVDNGKGFDLARVRANAGLRNIVGRCALIGFEARCITALGQGCSWRLRRR
ncbi:MAG: histidine kinase [Flavobacteriales bacterium]|nr:hypothetical protein [Flavobacteriales bacterium]